MIFSSVDFAHVFGFGLLAVGIVRYLAGIKFNWFTKSLAILSYVAEICILFCPHYKENLKPYLFPYGKSNKM